MGVNEGHDGAARPGDTNRGADLRGLAMLDAMGMLDDVDASDFDRAFRDASPAVQAELRELQASVATDPAFLAASEDPPADLKARTLARVMTDVERQDERFAPIAHIGRTASRASRVGPVDQREFIEQAMELAGARKDLERFSRSSYFWRAAAIAMTAALTAALAFQVSTKSFVATVTAYALGAAAPQVLLEELENPGAQQRFDSAVARRGVAGTDRSLFLALGKDGTCTALACGLQAGAEYRIRFVGDSGAEVASHRFTALRSTWAAEFDLPEVTAADFGRVRIEVVDASGAVVMRS
jgi:hypothetical protein